MAKINALGEHARADRSRYAHGEFEVKISRVGLWTAKNPVPPWEWRRTR